MCRRCVHVRHDAGHYSLLYGTRDAVRVDSLLVGTSSSNDWRHGYRVARRVCWLCAPSSAGHYTIRAARYQGFIEKRLNLLPPPLLTRMCVRCSSVLVAPAYAHLIRTAQDIRRAARAARTGVAAFTRRLIDDVDTRLVCRIGDTSSAECSAKQRRDASAISKTTCNARESIIDLCIKTRARN